LDYFDLSKVFIHEKFEDFLKENKTDVFLTDTQAKKKYSECSFNMADTFVFGSESRGINKSILNKFDEEKKKIMDDLINDNSSKFNSDKLVFTSKLKK